MDHRLHSSKPNGGGVELGPVSKGTAGADPAEHADGTVITIPDAMMLDPSVDDVTLDFDEPPSTHREPRAPEYHGSMARKMPRRQCLKISLNLFVRVFYAIACMVGMQGVASLQDRDWFLRSYPVDPNVSSAVYLKASLGTACYTSVPLPSSGNTEMTVCRSLCTAYTWRDWDSNVVLEPGVNCSLLTTSSILFAAGCGIGIFAFVLTILLVPAAIVYGRIIGVGTASMPSRGKLRKLEDLRAGSILAGLYPHHAYELNHLTEHASGGAGGANGAGSSSPSTSTGMAWTLQPEYASLTRWSAFYLTLALISGVLCAAGIGSMRTWNSYQPYTFALGGHYNTAVGVTVLNFLSAAGLFIVMLMSRASM